MTYSFTDQTLRDGVDSGFLDDRHTRTLGLRFQRSGRSLSAVLTNEHQVERSRLNSFDALQFSQSFSAKLNRVLLSISLNERFTEFINQRRTEDRLLARTTLQWQVLRTLSLDAVSVIRIREDSVNHDERFLENGVTLRWRLRRLDVNYFLVRYSGRQLGRDVAGIRTSFHVVRGF